MAVWGYGLLGPVEARVNGGVVPLTGARQRLVLAMLLLDANQLVPADRLIDELWGADLPQDPSGALRTQISRLRRVLGPAGDSLVTDGGGYRLSLRRDQLDAARFEDALAAATQATSQEALQLVDEALALWRGPALAEFADRPFAQPEAVRLDELRVVARERRAELVLSLPCRWSWLSTRNGSGRGGCSCRPCTGTDGTPRPSRRSGPGGVTCPKSSGWIPHRPCGGWNRTSCATRLRRRNLALSRRTGRCRCQ